MALFEQQDVQPFVDDALAQLQALRRQMPALLLAMQPKRDDITLVLQEVGESGGIERWLLPLLEDAPRRGWVIDGRPAVTSKNSDRKRKWGEPLKLENVKKTLRNPERGFHEVLLFVHGPNAGVFLALEAGVHRFQASEGSETPPFLIITPVAMRSSLSEKELELPAIRPPTPPPLKQLRLMPANRDHLADEKLELCNGARQMTLGSQGYFPDLEFILLEHIDQAERAGGLDREGLFSFGLDQVREAQR